MDKSLTINKNRIEWIDIAKGIGIILVIVAHAEIPYKSSFNNEVLFQRFFVYSFHMPLFFFLSGLCFKVNNNISFKTFLQKKAKGLMIPYLTFSIIWIIFESTVAIYQNQFTFHFIKNEIVTYLLQVRYHAIWFLPCMFVLEIVFYVMVRLIDEKWFLIFPTILLLLLGIMYRKYIDKNLPWNIDIIPMALPFFLVGYLLKDKLLKVKIKAWTSIALFMVFALLNQVTNYYNCKCFGEHFVDMYANSYCNYILFYISAFFGIASICALSCSIENTRHNSLSYIGKNTLVYFGIHQIIFVVTTKIIYHFGLSNGKQMLVWFFTILASIFLLTIFNEVLLRTKLKSLIGR